MTTTNLRDAIEVGRAMRKKGRNVEENEALFTLIKAAVGLRNLYDEHELDGESGDSAADQCASLYEVLNDVGLPVA